MSRLHGALSICLSVFALDPALSGEKILTGRFIENIQSTDFFMAAFQAMVPDGVKTRIGLAPSPKADKKEIDEAFSHFSDVRAAMVRVEALKREHGVKGGRVFVSFEYNKKGNLRVSCGISKAQSDDLADVIAHSVVPGSSPDGGSFHAFKQASRAERVRAIARCLATLDGMPQLKPTQPRIKGIYFDKESAAVAARWLRSLGFIGTKEQYDGTFNCLLTQAGALMPEAMGDVVVVKSLNFSHDYIRKRNDGYVIDTKQAGLSPGLLLAVMNKKAAYSIHDSNETTDFEGIWPSVVAKEMDERDQLKAILGPAARFVDGCRKQNGLISIGFSSGLQSPEPACEVNGASFE